MINFICEIRESRKLTTIVELESTISIVSNGLVSLERFLLCFNIDSWISKEIFITARYFFDTT